jgi:hypothetical protein
MHVTTLKCRMGWLTNFPSSSFCDDVSYLFNSGGCDHAKISKDTLRSLLQACDEARGMNSTQLEIVLQALADVLLTTGIC